MFSDTADSESIANQFIALQRARDIATQGWSDAKLPKGYTSAAKRELYSPNIVSATELAEKAIKENEEVAHALNIRIYHTSQLAKKRLLSEGDTSMALDSMRKIKATQQELVHAQRLIAGLEAFKFYLECGLIDAATTTISIDVIQNAPWDSKPSKDTDEELLQQLEENRLFPVVAVEESGEISFRGTPIFERQRQVPAAA